MNYLPKSAQTIADVIGREATLKLTNQYKQTHVYVPCRDLPENHPIVRAIGQDLARELQREFQGELIPIPSCRYIHVRKRNIEIQKKYAFGKSIRELAEEFSISRQNVGLIIQPDRANRHRKKMRESKRKQAQLRRGAMGPC